VRDSEQEFRDTLSLALCRAVFFTTSSPPGGFEPKLHRIDLAERLEGNQESLKNASWKPLNDWNWEIKNFLQELNFGPIFR
jgi:hypothetical protein